MKAKFVNENNQNNNLVNEFKNLFHKYEEQLNLTERTLFKDFLN
jgi:hypothetical protein